jgi:hypothetical protein
MACSCSTLTSASHSVTRPPAGSCDSVDWKTFRSLMGVRDHDLVETIRAAGVASPVTKVVELRSDFTRARAWLHVVATRVPSDLRTLVLLQDVTDLRLAEAARRDFVANVSHELRTPVASLKRWWKRSKGARWRIRRPAPTSCDECT